MAKKISKKLVIDASVARSCGRENSIMPTSKNCRDFLLEVLEQSHYFVMTPEIKAEWDKHQSSFALKWRAKMIAKKKLVYISEALLPELRKQIEATPEKDNNIKEAMLKDCLLIEAALATDKIVISLDEKVRRYFNQASVTVKNLKVILWINPDKSEDKAITWLQDGAKIEPARLLGHEQK